MRQNISFCVAHLMTGQCFLTSFATMLQSKKGTQSPCSVEGCKKWNAIAVVVSNLSQ